MNMRVNPWAKTDADALAREAAILQARYVQFFADLRAVLHPDMPSAAMLFHIRRRGYTEANIRLFYRMFQQQGVPQC